LSSITIDSIGSEFKLDQQGQDEFVHPGHNGLMHCQNEISDTQFWNTTSHLIGADFRRVIIAGINVIHKSNTLLFINHQSL